MSFNNNFMISNRDIYFKRCMTDFFSIQYNNISDLI